jgi:hypothetical protein
MRDQARFHHTYSANTDHLVQVGPPIEFYTGRLAQPGWSASQETMATLGAPTMK